MVFNKEGTLFVSDSFQGAIYRIEHATSCKPCAVTVISRDPLLATTGGLPFGANGLALSEDEQTLYVTNAGDGRLLKMPLVDGRASIVAESIPGADGLLLHDGLFWIAANQADSIFGVDRSGRLRAVAGKFEGISSRGAPIGLLFPASTVVQGDWMIVANLSMPITPAPGDEWEEDVTKWTLSKFRIPSHEPGAKTSKR